jgi:hypothetical protein
VIYEVFSLRHNFATDHQLTGPCGTTACCVCEEVVRKVHAELSQLKRWAYCTCSQTAQTSCAAFSKRAALHTYEAGQVLYDRLLSISQQLESRHGA